MALHQPGCLHRDSPHHANSKTERLKTQFRRGSTAGQREKGHLVVGQRFRIEISTLFNDRSAIAVLAGN